MFHTPSRRSSQREEKIVYAKRLRRRATPAEEFLWKAIRARKCSGIKFRRQVPFGPYIVDFCALDLRLIIEIDGEIHHNQQEADAARQTLLEERGFRVLRFSNTQVFFELQSTLEVISTVAEQQLLLLPLTGEGGSAEPDEGGRA